MSTNSIDVGMILSGLAIAASARRDADPAPARRPRSGSIVQKGKFAAAMPAFVSALNMVDLPTLGNPTIPHLIPIRIP